MEHLKDETAIDLIEGRIPPNAHAQSCAKCARELEHWKEILGSLKPSVLSSAPSAVLNKAIEIFPTEAKPSKITRLVADIIFDSLTEPALAGVRGPGDARQVVLRTDNVDIDLHISRTGGRTMLWGQLLPRMEDTMIGQVQVTLMCEGERLRSVRSNESGEFRFDDVPPGELSIGVHVPSLSRQVFGVFKIQRI
jgi:hypothetical protein